MRKKNGNENPVPAPKVNTKEGKVMVLFTVRQYTLEWSPEAIGRTIREMERQERLAPEGLDFK